ncbi:MAG: hypothetical protein FK733_14160, partial [Asgard group archaeon]|nr:hypothetical protein [Asgard group archaeon]
MIALYPMLVSNTVSRNIIPGVSKVLENFLIVYGMRNIMEKARGDRATKKGVSAYSFKKRLTIKESDDPLADYFFREVMFDQNGVINLITEEEFGQGWKNKRPEEMSGHELIKYGRENRTPAHERELEKRYETAKETGQDVKSIQGEASQGPSQIDTITDPGTKGKYPGTDPLPKQRGSAFS